MKKSTITNPIHGIERGVQKQYDIVADYPIYPKNYQPPEVDVAIDWRTWVYGGAKNPTT